MTRTIALALFASLVGCTGGIPAAPEPGPDTDEPVETGRRYTAH